jgi:hypothetical protein
MVYLKFYVTALMQDVLKYYITALIQGEFKYYIAALIQGVFESSKLLIYFTYNFSVGPPTLQMSMHFTLSKPMPSVSSNIALYTAEHAITRIFLAVPVCDSTHVVSPRPVKLNHIRLTYTETSYLYSMYFEQATEIFHGIFKDAFSGPYYTELNERILRT